MPESAMLPLVLGASGQVGYFLLQQLGAALIPASRRVPEWAGPAATRWQPLDLWVDTWPSPSATLISAGPLDGCLAWLSRSGPGALQRIVALSSMSAVHKLASPAPGERAVALALGESEQQLVAFSHRHAIALTLLRPTLIWGAGLDHSLTPYAQRALRRGHAWIPTGARGLRQPVHARDLAQLSIALAQSDPRPDACFEVGGRERLSVADMLRRVVHSQSATAITLPLPTPLLRAVASAALHCGIERAGAWRRAVDDQCADSDVLWRSVGITPRGFDPDASSWIPPAAS